MQFFSTRNAGSRVSAAQAIVQGLSSEGGLFVPESFPQADLKTACERGSYAERAAYVLGLVLPGYPQEFVAEATEKTYGEAFQGKAGYLRPVNKDLYSLELWHGPTCAFKDYALQIMPKLLVKGKELLGRSELTYILVATSGDTGKAALAGYQDVPGVKIAVFYPSHGTSQVQRLQMTTQQGDNVAVYAVKGNFDDAQTGVKKVFADQELGRQLAEQNVCLSSANSINWGRLAPQIVYYFAAYRQLLEQGRIQMGDAVDFCVPTGNFGDILAGYYAKRMGLPVGRLVCASNRNNVLTEFLKTGHYDARRTFYRTTSPSMDILVSSNLERLLYHMCEDTEKVSGWMEELRTQGHYQVDAQCLEKIQEIFSAGCTDDEQAAEEISAMFQGNQYLCDPHTAVAFRVAQEYKNETSSGAPMVVLSTASPFKFPGDVLKALGQPVPEDEFEAMRQLAAHTNVPAPQALASLQGQPERFDREIEPEQIREIAKIL